MSASHGSHRCSHSQGGNASSSFCTDGDEFPRAVAQAAVAQICEATGFHSIQSSALETLADIAIRYLCDTGKVSQLYANLAGRTQSNALDVLAAIEDVSGGCLTDARGAIETSGTVAELKRFVDYAEETPFCKPVPHFPICKRRSLIPSFAQLQETPPHPHIPSWLPAFPDPHTYKSTPVWNERKVDPRVDKLEQAKQRRKAERSLVSLHLRLCTSGAASFADATPTGNGHTFFPSEDSRPSHIPVDVDKSFQPSTNTNMPKFDGQSFANTHNPFLLPPLPPDAKEVSALNFSGAKPLSPIGHSNKPDASIALPSALEAFLPALAAATHEVQENGEALKTSSGLLSDSKNRMPFSMTFDFGKRATEKAVTASLSLGGKGKKKGRVDSKDEDKDEKKKRAEQILGQSVDPNS